MAKKRTKKTNGTLFKIFSIVAWAILLVGSVVGVLLVIDVAKSELLLSFKYENRSAVETMVGNINQVYDEYESGALSEEKAREIATRMVQNGVWNDGRRGFWAIEPDGTLVAKVENGDMSSKPGDNVWDYQDADGKYVEREMVAAGQNGGGFVEFRVENDAVNNSYIGYALVTDFGFVVDATFDMNYFNQYWESSIVPKTAQYTTIVLVCFIIILAIIANANLFFNRK